MKKIKISICGALGKMGLILIKRVQQYQNLELHSATDKRIKKLFNKVEIKKNSLKVFEKTHVIIDFSNPKSTMQILEYANKLKKNVLIGTTGFTNKQEALIKKYSKKIAIFKSGNMSLGINLLEYITSILSKKIPSDYQIGISDNHHIAKIDYPSGTALMLANAVAKGKNKNLDLTKTLLIGGGIGAGLGSLGLIGLSIKNKEKVIDAQYLKDLSKDVNSELEVDNYLRIIDLAKLSDADKERVFKVINGVLLAKKDKKWDENADIKTKKAILLNYKVSEFDFKVFYDVIINRLADILTNIVK
jgi:4-hydroxy-tetrahydrodipicolinate reductase